MTTEQGWISERERLVKEAQEAGKRLSEFNGTRPSFPAQGQALITLADDGGLNIERKDKIAQRDVLELIAWLHGLYPGWS